MSGEPTVISTFCGTGGSSLGYKWAGFKELLAIDFDSHAVQCFKANFPEVPCWHKSVRDITGQQILDFCKIKKGELDVFDGSPPCQGFSTAGKREVNDNRNDLFKDYVRLIKELEPKVFVMENVTGMAKGTMKGRFIEIMKTLKALDYNVKCKQMNSMYYGVPQSRERLIFIGVRNDLGLDPVYPVANKNIITVGKALKNVTPKFMLPIKQKHKEVFKYIKPGQSAINAVPKSVLKKYIPRMVNNKTFSFGGICRRLMLNKPAPTITKTFIEFSEPPIHPIEDRYLSIEETAVLCSFPSNWNLGNNFTKAWARLGNAVMPKFMQAIAETIKTEMLEKAEKLK